MKRNKTFALLFISLFSLSFFAHDHNHDHEAKGLDFIKNKTQWHENVKYSCAVMGGKVFLEDQGFTYSFLEAEDLSLYHDMQYASEEESKALLSQLLYW